MVVAGVAVAGVAVVGVTGVAGVAGDLWQCSTTSFKTCMWFCKRIDSLRKKLSMGKRRREKGRREKGRGEDKGRREGEGKW